jgi:hypothetical protein
VLPLSAACASLSWHPPPALLNLTTACLSGLLSSALLPLSAYPTALPAPQNGSEISIVGTAFNNNKAGVTGGAMRAQVGAGCAALLHACRTCASWQAGWLTS